MHNKEKVELKNGEEKISLENDRVSRSPMGHASAKDTSCKSKEMLYP